MEHTVRFEQAQFNLSHEDKIDQYRMILEDKEYNQLLKSKVDVLSRASIKYVIKDDKLFQELDNQNKALVKALDQRINARLETLINFFNNELRR